jgi:Ca2+-binding RTX toxin-like protein
MRTPLTLLATSAALLAFAPAALADTTVSIKSAADGSRFLNVTDTLSLFDEPMDVRVERSGTKLKVTDAVGKVHAGAECTISGAAAFCASNVTSQRIEGSDKNDVLTTTVDLPAAMDGDSGDDVLNGGPARDTFGFERGNDRFNGNAGVDTVSYAGAPSGVNITLDDGLLNVGPSSEPDRLVAVENAIGSPSSDFIRGTDDRNTLSGRAGNDTILGLDGDDLIDGEGGADDMLGGAGRDTVDYRDRTNGVNVSINNVANDGEPGEGDNVRMDVETLQGGAGPDVVVAQPIPVANALRGNDGNDVLDGAAGSDGVDGGLGNDRIVGDPGADRYDGGAGFDTLDYSPRSGEFSEPIAVTLASLNVPDDGGDSDGPLGARDTSLNVEAAVTGDNDDTVTGSGAGESITTGDGSDTIEPGAGRDAVDAGAGDDTLHIRDGEKDAPVKCGAGTDEVEADFPLDFSNLLGFAQLQDCEVIVP